VRRAEVSAKARLKERHIGALFGLGLALGSAAACSAGGSNAAGGGIRGGGAGAGGGSAGSLILSSGASNFNPSGGDDSVPPDGGGCQHFDVSFVPKIPTVFILVDRSGSMFSPNNGVVSWPVLKTGVLDVVKQLQAQIRFGFGTVAGQMGGTCPVFEPVAPALSNYDAISAAYLPMDRLPGGPGETPVIETLPLVADVLTKDTGQGDKYILFVTDGEPDFCDNGEAACPVDTVVERLQKLSTQGINTVVFGLPSGESPISTGTLQAFANAGAGQPVALPFSTKTAQDVCYACQGVTGWKAEWATVGGTPDCQTPMKQVLGTYSPTAGNATVYHPDPADQAALTAQIASVVSGIKSCTFDLGGKISVNLGLLSEAGVSIEGQAVPLSMTDGWRMNTDTQLELVGSACSTWRKPENTHIAFDFPCDIIVPK